MMCDIYDPDFGPVSLLDSDVFRVLLTVFIRFHCFVILQRNLRNVM